MSKLSRPLFKKIINTLNKPYLFNEAHELPKSLKKEKNKKDPKPPKNAIKNKQKENTKFKIYNRLSELMVVSWPTRLMNVNLRVFDTIKKEARINKGFYGKIKIEDSKTGQMTDGEVIYEPQNKILLLSTTVKTINVNHMKELAGAVMLKPVQVEVFYLHKK